MMRYFQFIFYFLGGLILFSCSQKYLSPDEYIKWVNNKSNGLVCEKKIGEYEYAVLYKPLEFVALQENRGDVYNADSLNKIKNNLQGMQYFTLKIKSDKNKEIMGDSKYNRGEYEQRLEYYLGEMQNDISLIDGTDTLPCVLFHYERNYGLSPNNNFVVAFNKKEKTTGKTSDKTFVINDRVLGAGLVQLSVKGEDIDNVPKLQLK